MKKQGTHIDGMKKCSKKGEKTFNIGNHQGNANQNDNEIAPFICQNGYYQSQEIISVGEDVKKRRLIHY